MFFRNLSLFVFPVGLDLSTLEDALALCPLRPVGALELHSAGFVSPFGRDSEVLAHRIDTAIWVSVGTETRLLPAAVVNDLLAKKLAAIEEKEGRKPGGRARKRIKEDLVHELLPRAFVQPGRTDAVLLTDLGLLAVDTTSRKTAENVVSALRLALGSFPALPLNAEVAPRSVLTGWVAGEPLPEGLTLGDEAQLRDAADRGARATLVHQELQVEEVEQHLLAGKQVTRLALTLSDHVSFTLGEDLVIRKFKLLDGAVDSLESTERDDLRAELDARFVLFAGELRGLYAVLQRALKLTPAEGADPDALGMTGAAIAGRAALGRLRGMAREEGCTLTISGPGGSVTIGEGGGLSGFGDAQDPLYPQAVAVVREKNRASISTVQRVLKIGYNRAARFIEQMEAERIVSPPDARGERTVLQEPA